jgi:hypothetical protein
MPSCSVADEIMPMATCTPAPNSTPETCDNALDDNCNGQIDEGCAPPRKRPPLAGAPDGDGADVCGGDAGADPIVIATRSAVTNPFRDFVADSLARIDLTRIYSSADVSVRTSGGPGGLFGKGWQHSWDMVVTCNSAPNSITYCSLLRGASPGLRFKRGALWWQHFVPLDGSQGGVLIQTYANPGFTFDHHAADGRIFRFAMDASPQCLYSDPYFGDALRGGHARLRKVIDAAGNAIDLEYDWPNGVLLRIVDHLGHVLELRNPSACQERRAKELWYDGVKYVTYEYGGASGAELRFVRDRENRIIRSYEYAPDGSGRLLVVKNESGGKEAEFGYSATGAATSLKDALSDVTVDYRTSTSVDITSRFNADGLYTSTQELGVDRSVRSISATSGSTKVTWSGRRLGCVEDPMGRIDYYEYDAFGRAVRHATYAAGQYDCSSPAPPSSEITPLSEVTYAYGIVRTPSQYTQVPLSWPTQIQRRSALASLLTGADAQAPYSQEEFDYDCQGSPSLITRGSAKLIATSASSAWASST